jgi:hypothetical protein
VSRHKVHHQNLEQANWMMTATLPEMASSSKLCSLLQRSTTQGCTLNSVQSALCTTFHGSNMQHDKRRQPRRADTTN